MKEVPVLLANMRASSSGKAAASQAAYRSGQKVLLQPAIDVETHPSPCELDHATAVWFLENSITFDGRILFVIVSAGAGSSDEIEERGQRS